MGRQGASLAAGRAEVHKNHLGTWANDSVKITRGFDVLWVYGYIKYSDAFGFVRETWYCYRRVHQLKGGKLPALSQVGQSHTTAQHKDARARIQIRTLPAPAEPSIHYNWPR